MEQLINECYVSYDIRIMCEAFADRVIATNKDEYARRKQSDIDKIRNDIVTGKLAEWGVYFIYIKRGRYLDPPDMKIYYSWNKSFDPDLRWDVFNLHIKSQTIESSMRYGNSWIFQSKDPLFEFSNQYDIVVACRVSIEEYPDGGFIQIMLEEPFKNLKISDPKLSKFKGNKKALYLEENNE